VPGLKIEILPLQEENMKDCPEWRNHPYSCKYCLYWQFPELTLNLTREKEKAFQEKLKWLQGVQDTFGNCGKLLYLDGKCVGFAQYAPPRFLPQVKDYSARPVSKDCVFISCLFIPERENQGKGLGKMILQSILEDLKERDFKAVETFPRRGSSENPSGPVEFYRIQGFKIIKDDPEFPLLRWEL